MKLKDEGKRKKAQSPILQLMGSSLKETWRVKLCRNLFYGAKRAELQETPRTCLFNLGPIQ